MTLAYDLHSHSIASDGTLTPQELVNYAHKAGVDVLALTDHDTIDGIAEAQQAARHSGLHLIPGIELSVSWGSHVIHVVGLNINPGDEVLAKGLVGLLEFRQWRGEEIGRRLAKQNIEGAYEGALTYTRGNVISRTHYARWLVAQGLVKDVNTAFKRYLGNGKRADVRGEWASLQDAVNWITGAGGQAVIAHPARYRLTATRMRKLLAEFREHGGAGLEVVSGSHSRDETYHMATQARVFELYASAGSDYHGPVNPWVELGRIPSLPQGCVPIWRDWGLEKMLHAGSES